VIAEVLSREKLRTPVNAPILSTAKFTDRHCRDIFIFTTPEQSRIFTTAG
jgi:hypothetical protein